MNKTKEKMRWMESGMRAVFSAFVLVQIYFCICYLVQGGGELQFFEESLNCINASVAHCTNGWQLIGYPVIIAAVRMVLGEWYIWGIIFLQFAVSAFAFYYVLQVFEKTVWKRKGSIPDSVLMTLFLLSNPFIFQMIAAVLPDVLALDMFLLSVSQLMLMIWGERRFWRFRILGMAGCVLFEALLNRYYLWSYLMTAFAVIILSVCRNAREEYRKKAELLLLAGILLLSAGIGWEINHKTANSEGYMKYSVMANLTDRFVYPNFYEDSKNYPETVKEAVPKEYFSPIGARKISYFKEEVAPFLEQEYGIKKANELYWEMIKTGIGMRTKSAIKGMVRDLAFHYTQVFTALRKLNHNNQSRYGYNISRMWDGASALVLRMFIFGSCSQAAAGTLLLVRFVAGKLVWKKEGNVPAMVLAVVPAVILTFLMTLFSPAGIDYRIGLCFMTVFFLLLSTGFGKEDIV